MREFIVMTARPARINDRAELVAFLLSTRQARRAGKEAQGLAGLGVARLGKATQGKDFVNTLSVFTARSKKGNRKARGT